MAARLPTTIPISRLVDTRLSECPTELMFTFHWLAVNGTQPVVPENQSEIGRQVVATEEITWPWQDAVPGRRVVSKLGLSSEEHRLFHSVLLKIRDETPIGNVLEELRTNSSLQGLLPFFLRYLIDATRANLHRPGFVLRLLSVANALFQNEALDLSSTFHHFLSVAITPIVTRIMFEEDEFTLKDEAAAFTGAIVARFAEKFPGLRQRVTELLADVVCDTRSPARAKYGAIAGLLALEPGIAERVVMPRLPGLLADVQAAIDGSRDHGLNEQLRLKALLLDFCRIVMERNTEAGTEPGLRANEEIIALTRSYFGPALF
jgi:hypothetical protein